MKPRDPKERRNLELKIGNLYKRLDCVNLSVCWYCGDPRETLDHCPPLSVAIYYEQKELAERGIRLVLIPSCTSCNSILGHKALMTPASRLTHLYEQYSKKISKRGTLWDKEELDEFGYNLRQMVESNNRILNNLLRKHRGCEQRLSKLTDDYE